MALLQAANISSLIRLMSVYADHRIIFLNLTKQLLTLLPTYRKNYSNIQCRLKDNSRISTKFYISKQLYKRVKNESS